MTIGAGRSMRRSLSHLSMPRCARTRARQLRCRFFPRKRECNNSANRFLANCSKTGSIAGRRRKDAHGCLQLVLDVIY